MMLPRSYTELVRYDGAAVQRDERKRIVQCAIQPRDLAVVIDVWRYKFLTSTQILELHWNGCVPRVANKRLTKLFDAGFVDRFRPVTRSGSFPWTYQLGPEGHRLLREIGRLDTRARFQSHKVYDYRYVLHEVHLNAWVLAWRRMLGDRMMGWQGECEIEPPADVRKDQPRLTDGRSVAGLRDGRGRLIRPDAIVRAARRSDGGTRAFLIEYDRTRRVDKNFEKFLRYDALLCSWWRYTELADHGVEPFVVFVCQDDDQRDTFLRAADHQLTGHVWHASDGASGHEYPGREHMLFAVEVDVHLGDPGARRVPPFPSGHPRRHAEARLVEVELPICSPALQAA
jgi:protein involved in plasmid replication-relaxation